MTQEEKLEKEYKQTLVKILANTNEDTHLNKMKMIDFVKKYVFLLLSKEYKLNKINMPRVEFFDDDEVEGYFDYNSLTIQLSEASFLNRETLIEDIDTIFHEMRHFAQYVADRKDNDKLSRNKATLPRGSAIVNALTYSNLNSKEIEKLSKGDTKAQYKYFVNFDKYFHYFNKLYYLRDVEMDARSFSANTLYDLLFDIDVSKFNQNEQKNLEFFREKASQVFQDEEDVLFNTEATFVIPKQTMDKEIINLQNNIIEKYPNIFDAIAKNQEELDVIDCEMHYDVRSALVESLAFVYNDELAHKLMNSFLESIENDSEYASFNNYYNDIINIYVYSNFKFTKEELNKFTFDDVQSDKIISMLNNNRKMYKEYLQEIETQNDARQN